jgi:hypothetical protein
MEAASTHARRLRRAFFDQHNLILLGGSVAVAIAFASWAPAIVGLAAEALWLGGVVSSPRVRRWVFRQAGKAGPPLPANGYTARAESLGRAARTLRPILGGRIPDATAKLDAIPVLFNQMAALHGKVAALLDSDGPRLQQEVVRFTQLLAEEKDPAVRLTLRQALALAQRRQKQHEQLEKTRRMLEAKMSALEASFEALRSRAAGGAAREELSAALDELAAAALFVTELESETSTVLSRLVITDHLPRTVGPGV